MHKLQVRYIFQVTLLSKMVNTIYTEYIVNTLMVLFFKSLLLNVSVFRLMCKSSVRTLKMQYSQLSIEFCTFIRIR